MKKEVIFCDLCPTAKQSYSIYACMICGRDCCHSHIGTKLPQVIGIPPPRATCTECNHAMDSSKFSPPQDLIDALTRWQDQIVEQTKAEIAAKALRGGLTPFGPPFGPISDEGQRISDEEVAREIADEEAAFKEGINEQERQFPRRQMIP